MADTSYIDLLLADLEAKRLRLDWWNVDDVAEIRKWKAFRESDKAILQSLHSPTWKSGRGYKADPLPKTISRAYANFLFQQPPIVTPQDEGNRAAQTDLLREARVTSKLREAADICVTEREVWWHIFTNPEISDWPQLEWVSRANVVPYMIGDRVMAVAFVNEYLPRVEGDPTYRHLECHEDGRVLNVLYKAAAQKRPKPGQSNSSVSDATQGTSEDIGEQVNLTEFTLTAEIEPEWQHNLKMLAGRISNDEDARSVYDGLEDFFLDLNEAHAVDAENFRLAGKKRAMIPKKYADQAGEIDSAEEIFWTDTDDELDGGQDVIKVLEYSYSSADSVARKDDLAQTAITRAGLARQLVDANADEGLAQTGTALRTRLLPTIASISGKSQQWVDKLPHTLCLLAQVDALPPGGHGGGHSWSAPELPPSVTLASPLPVDETEEATRHQTLVNAELESLETAIQELHPTWSVDRRVLEVRRILANRAGYALDDEGNRIDAGTENPPPPGSRNSGNPPVENPANPQQNPAENPQQQPVVPPGGGGATPPVSQG